MTGMTSASEMLLCWLFTLSPSMKEAPHRHLSTLRKRESFTCDSLEMLMFSPFGALWDLAKQPCDLTPVVCFWSDSKSSGQCWTSHVHSYRPSTGNGMAVLCARPFQTSVPLPMLLSQSEVPSFNINLEDCLSSTYLSIYLPTYLSTCQLPFIL